MLKNCLFCLYALLVVLGAIPAHLAVAQEQKPEEFVTGATAIDAATLYTNRYLISLWGIEPANISAAVTLKARTYLDNVIGGQPVHCEVKNWQGERPLARCLTAQEVDIGLSMVDAGYAVVDRAAVSSTVFSDSYLDAENDAQGKSLGAWADEGGGHAFLKYFNNDEGLVYGWLAGVLIVPVLCLLIICLITITRFDRLEKYLKETIGESEARKKDLRDQERFVVASMIEGELTANKGKLEAFIIIYKDLLKSLRQAKEHRYQTSGEIVHDAPLLERAVYDNNINRLELLGVTMAGEVVGLYADIQSNPNYTTLDATVPLDQAILKVQKVVLDAEKLIPKIDKIIQSLHVTIRDKQTRQARTA